MTTQTKEDKVIEQANQIVLDFTNSDNTLQDNYQSLLKDYQKLTKKYNKMIKLGDSYSSKVMTSNNDIQSFAKKKIFEAISSSNELKQKHSEELSKCHEILEKFKSQYQTQSTHTTKINKELKVSKEEIITLKETNKLLISRIEVLKEFQTSFEVTLENEVNKAKLNKSGLAVAIVGIDNFISLKTLLSQFTTLDNFILGTIKYLKNSLKKDDIVIYFESEMFYVLMPDIKIEDAVKTLKVVGKRRTINLNHITLSSGVTILKDNDTVDSILTRCLDGYNKAIADTEHCIVVEV